MAEWTIADERTRWRFLPCLLCTHCGKLEPSMPIGVVEWTCGGCSVSWEVAEDYNEKLWRIFLAPAAESERKRIRREYEDAQYTLDKLFDNQHSRIIQMRSQPSQFEAVYAARAAIKWRNDDTAAA